MLAEDHDADGNIRGEPIEHYTFICYIFKEISPIMWLQGEKTPLLVGSIRPLLRGSKTSHGGFAANMLLIMK